MCLSENTTFYCNFNEFPNSTFFKKAIFESWVLEQVKRQVPDLGPKKAILVQNLTFKILTFVSHKNKTQKMCVAPLGCVNNEKLIKLGP